MRRRVCLGGAAGRLRTGGKGLARTNNGRSSLNASNDLFASLVLPSLVYFHSSGATGRCLSTAATPAVPSVETIEHPEDPRVPSGHWTNIKNRKGFLERAGAKLGVKELSDWYSITRKQIMREGGRMLFAYHPSLEDALQSIYPDYQWDPLLFIEGRGRSLRGLKKNPERLLRLLDRVEQQLGINDPEDWHSVMMADVIQLGFPTNFSRADLVGLLKYKYPTYSWDKVFLMKGRFASQKKLERAVIALFKDREIIVNARKEAGVLNPETGDFFELDLYIPSRQLAFEYNERHHYTSSEYTFYPLNHYQTRDEKKKESALQRGITLIVIPCWWDGTLSSLVATIRQVRPDLVDEIFFSSNMQKEELLKAGVPIPQEPPEDFLKKHTDYVQDIGEPVNACFLTEVNTDPSGWWMFEKYDGLRGFWNPWKKAFYSRKGNKFNFPEEVIATMPLDMFLDGEIWFGRDNFAEATKISGRAATDSIDWSKFKYMVFDVPNMEGTYEERYNHLVNRLKGNEQLPYIEIAPKEQCKGVPHLEEFFQNVIDEGGEGIILRDPKAPFQRGRAPGYLKHKKFRDAEARIVGSAGHHQWECELPNGVTFIAPTGTTEFAKRWNPQPGDIVSFKHRGFLLASKKPKFPALYRLRTDMTWEDVQKNWKENKVSTKASLRLAPRVRARPKGYWMERANRREFFIRFAEEAGFDPFILANWKKVTRKQIIAKQGGRALGLFKGSIKDALEDAFPELPFKKSEPKNTETLWNTVQESRVFFDELAKRHGFDPLDVRNWYQDMSYTDKDSLYVLPIRAVRKALKKAYPELEFKRWEKKKEKVKRKKL